ncbi:MAG TPA: MDR family MFS transporter [Chloroflexia bacterium]
MNKEETQEIVGKGTPGAIGANDGAYQEADETPRLPARQLATIMISVLLGILLSALDQTIVGPAMPRIIGDLNGFEAYSWVFTVYLLTSTITVPIFGKLSDMYGRKWFYIGGILVFLFGSVLSGLSADMTQLITFRGLQGIGAGIMMATAFAIIADLIPPAERGKWQGAFGAVFGLASVIGPTVGGFLTDNLDWRWVFYVNLPVGAIALTALLFLFPNDRKKHHTRRSIDWLGAGTLVAGLTPLLLALSLAGTTTRVDLPGVGLITDWGWGSPGVITLLAASVAFLVAFVFVQSRAKEPIIPLDLFKHNIFTVSMITVFLTGVGMFGAVLYIPLFIQAIQGDSATNGGNSVTPMTLAIVLSSIVTGQIISRTGKYRIIGIVGMVMVTGGAVLLYSMNMDTPRLLTIGYMVVMGFGLGIAFPLYTLVVQNAFPIQRVGVVTAAVTFFRSIGGTVGVAVLGSVVNNQFHSKFPAEFTAKYNQFVEQTIPAAARGNMPPADTFLTGLSNLNPQILTSVEGIAQMKAQLIERGAPAAFVDQLMGIITEAMKPALFSGIQEAFFIASIMLGLGLVATFFLREIPLRKSNAARSMATMAEGGAEAVAEEAGKEMAASGMPGGTMIPRGDVPVLRRK